MKTLNLLILIFASILGTHLAIGADTPTNTSRFGADTGDRPIGVAATDWISVSEKLGFVVVSNVGDPKIIYPSSPQGERAQPLLRGVTPPVPAAGYFMIKTTDGWRRIVVMTPAEIAAVAAR